MGGSTVLFETPSAFTKKRKRMPGTDSTKKVEIKQWNPRYIGEGDTYNGVAFTNVLNPGNDSVAAASSWMPFKIYWPEMGTGSYQKIGKSIFLKYLRFKGFIRVYASSFVGSRWRLRLIRCDSYYFTDSHGGHGEDAIKEYLKLYKNVNIPENFNQPNTIWLYCCHNFYKALKNVDNNNVVRSKVIASGYIPPFNRYEDGETRGLVGGTGGQLIDTLDRRFYYNFTNGMYNIPIDVKVTCNDYIKDDIYYYYVLETDCGVGFNMQAETVTSAMSASLQAAHAMYEVSFFIRGYFTDL